MSPAKNPGAGAAREGGSRRSAEPLRVAPHEPAPTDYARCRALGHSWDSIPVTKPASFGATIDLRCEHCHMIRRDIVSPFSGRLLQRVYTRPAGYSEAKGDHWMRADWRVAWATGLPAEQLVVASDPDRPRAKRRTA